MASSGPGTGIASIKQERKPTKHTFNIIPEVIVYNEKEETHNSTESDNKSKDKPASKSFFLFYCNVSSFSRAVSDYLFALPPEVKGIMICETHKPNSSIEGKLHRHGYTGACNEPQETEDGGTHGGELVAIRSKYKAKVINPDILAQISKHYGTLRFAAMILTVKKVDVLVVTLYLWHTEGFTERNQIILSQIQMLKYLLKIPMIVAADFNITFEKFSESGWCERLKVRMVHPGISSTTKLSTNRVIDFVLISLELDPGYKSIRPILTVPCHPHYGLLIELSGNPRVVEGYVQCIPRKLPMKEFQPEYKKLTPEEATLIWSKCHKRSRDVLIKQKKKTGVGILGKPLKVLANDVTFQGELKQQQIFHGEKLALASLATEFFVLDVAKVPRKDQHKYTGRGQYPQIKYTPLIPKVNVNIESEK